MCFHGHCRLYMLCLLSLRGPHAEPLSQLFELTAAVPFIRTSTRMDGFRKFSQQARKRMSLTLTWNSWEVRGVPPVPPVGHHSSALETWRRNGGDPMSESSAVRRLCRGARSSKSETALAALRAAKGLGIGSSKSRACCRPVCVSDRRIRKPQSSPISLQGASPVSPHSGEEEGKGIGICRLHGIGDSEHPFRDASVPPRCAWQILSARHRSSMVLGGSR